MKMKQKVVLFDIDYTLFDTEQFRDKLYKGLEDVLEQKVQDAGTGIYKDIRKELGYFNPNLFLKRLAKHLKREADKEALRNVIWDEVAMRACIYPETEGTIEQLAKEALIGIFSKGFNTFQRAKLIAIKHFLDDQHIHVTVNKETRLPKLIKKYEGKRLYLVDDALDILSIAKKLDTNIFTIWVKRGRFAEMQEPIEGFVPDAIVLNLRTVVKIVTKN